jgi:hypothetical protein
LKADGIDAVNPAVGLDKLYEVSVALVYVYFQKRCLGCHKAATPHSGTPESMRDDESHNRAEPSADGPYYFM